jgi:NDP-sugar pyrophosphorylase family protein
MDAPPRCRLPASRVSDLDALVLCGGLGTRLRPLVSGCPKPLAEVAGRPFLTILLDSLARQGLRRFILCAGFLAEVIEALQPELTCFGEVEISRETSPLGTGGAVLQAIPRTRSDPVLVLNGDSICRVDLDGMLRFHRARDARLTIAVCPAPQAGGSGARADYGYVRLGPDDSVSDFAEKASGSRGLVNAGVYLVEPGFFERSAPRDAFSLERELFPTCSPGQAFGFRLADSVVDIGTPERYRDAEHALRGLGLLRTG